jgi:hypothetical protein
LNRQLPRDAAIGQASLLRVRYPSGGSSDSFTLAIGHKDHANNHIIIDAVREVRPPFSPEAAIAELAALCQRYRISRVTGDRYGETSARSLRKVLYQIRGERQAEIGLVPRLLGSAQQRARRVTEAAGRSNHVRRAKCAAPAPRAEELASHGPAATTIWRTA